MFDQDTVREILGQLEDNNRMVEIFRELLNALNSMMCDLSQDDRPLPEAVLGFLESYRGIVDGGFEPEQDLPSLRLH
jgi:hypothetical protein